MTVDIKERPILFTTRMIEAILDTASPKTATRRIFKGSGSTRYGVKGNFLWVKEAYIIGDDPSQGLSLTKTAQVHKCGNSVCPPVAEAIVKANL
jgi:DNA (cytosine-5)-methyltransferase 1